MCMVLCIIVLLIIFVLYINAITIVFSMNRYLERGIINHLLLDFFIALISTPLVVYLTNELVYLFVKR